MSECCAKVENREQVSREAEGETVRTVERCAVCGRKHYTLEIPAIKLGLEVK
jgi:ribosomal protein S14